MKPNIETIIKILSLKGHQQYGQEPVSQLDHALQCATLAETSGASKELITASLFHDFGHLIHDLGEDAPIRLHVEAKRYLCAIKSNYFAILSPASQKSLELQGGVFSSEAATKFINQPYAKDAVKLRIWDDQAKVIGKKTPDLKYFTKIVYQGMVISSIANVLSSKFISSTEVNHQIIS